VLVGLKVAVLVVLSYATDPPMDAPAASLTVNAMEDGTTAWLKEALGVVATGTPVAAFGGVTDVTAGGVLAEEVLSTTSTQ